MFIGHPIIVNSDRNKDVWVFNFYTAMHRIVDLLCIGNGERKMDRFKGEGTKDWLQGCRSEITCLTVTSWHDCDVQTNQGMLRLQQLWKQYFRTLAWLVSIASKLLKSGHAFTFSPHTFVSSPSSFANKA